MCRCDDQSVGAHTVQKGDVIMRAKAARVQHAAATTLSCANPHCSLCSNLPCVREGSGDALSSELVLVGTGTKLKPIDDAAETRGYDRTVPSYLDPGVPSILSARNNNNKKLRLHGHAIRHTRQ